MLVHRKIIQCGGLATVLCLGALTGTLFAQASAPSPSPSAGASATPALEAASPAPTPTLEQRVAGLEAYLTNGDPTVPLKDKDGNIPKDLTTASVGTPGPGHNAWMLTSSALVLFMTLPGLALFYGGLVRRKNALSVLAQCLGITGLVTILWWAFGYSLVFGKNLTTHSMAGPNSSSLMASLPHRTPITLTGYRKTSTRCFS
jgi:ammonium transporter family